MMMSLLFKLVSYGYTYYTYYRLTADLIHPLETYYTHYRPAIDLLQTYYRPTTNLI